MELAYIDDINIESLVTKQPFKLSLNEICRMFNLDIENDNRNKVFWNININNKVLIDDQLFNYLGYKGISYSNKKHALTNLLKSPANKYIKYEEVTDEKDQRKKYYVFSGIDFECLLMQMRTEKVVELRRLFSKMKHIFVKFCEYERLYEKHQSQIMNSQNSILLKSVEELKSLVVTVKSTADEERVKAEEERLKAEQERIKAEEREQKSERERVKAEEERVKAEEERSRAEQRSIALMEQMKRNVTILNTVIAPRMAPLPIGRNKIRILGKLLDLNAIHENANFCSVYMQDCTRRP